MNNVQTYEQFPFRFVIASVFFSLTIYATGAYIVSGLSIFALVLYIGYCLWVEFRVLKESCVNCYYYGKTCAFGKGRLCKLFYKKGDPQKFAEKNISWTDMLPDFIVLLLPMVVGLRILIRQFSWLTLILMILLLTIGFAGNAFIRGSYACKFCKQREIGCPAEKLFQKKRTAKYDERSAQKEE